MSRSPEVEQAYRRGASMRGTIADAACLAAEVERLEAHVAELKALREQDRAERIAIMKVAKMDAETAEALAERLKGHLLAHDAERTLYLRRLLWLHDCSAGTTDADGYEWGIYRVKWVNGQVAEFWQTNSDFSDLDAAMERDGYKLPASAKALEARVKELERHLHKEADGNRELMKVVAGLEGQNAKLRAALDDYQSRLVPNLRAELTATRSLLDEMIEWTKKDISTRSPSYWIAKRKAALNGGEASK